MKFAIGVVALAGLAIGLAVTGPAAARTKHHHAKRQVAHVTRCDAGAQQLSWGFLTSGAAPQWNGCSPPIYDNGTFVGQDPDPNVRATLRRDPDEGYHPRHD